MILNRNKTGVPRGILTPVVGNIATSYGIASLARAVDLTGSEGDVLTNAVHENVRLTVSHLAESSQIIKSHVESGELKVVGGVYELATDRVTLVD